MAQAKSFRTPALILKRRDMGEADRLLTLLTPYYGKIDAIAKGARKPSSRKTGHVELFTKAELIIARGREFGIITQAEVAEPYLPIRDELQRGAYANYVVELLDRFVFAGDDTRDLFTLLDNTLMRICVDGDIRRVVRYYELNLLEHIGYRPELSECVITRDILLPEDQYFSFADGGVVSPEGARYATGMVGLPTKTLKLLRFLQRNKYKSAEKMKIDEATHRDAERIMLGYIAYVLEQKLQSVDFIRRIRRFTAPDES